MRTAIQGASVLLLLSINSANAQADSLRGEVAEILKGQQTILSEIRKLRLALLESRFEANSERIPVLELSLGQIRSELDRVLQEQDADRRSAAQLDAQVSSAVNEEDRRHLQALRANLSAEQDERLRQQQTALRQKAVEVTSRLEGEQRRLRDLREQIAVLRATP